MKIELSEDQVSSLCYILDAYERFVSNDYGRKISEELRKNIEKQAREAMEGKNESTS